MQVTPQNSAVPQQKVEGTSVPQAPVINQEPPKPEVDPKVLQMAMKEKQLYQREKAAKSLEAKFAEMESKVKQYESDYIPKSKFSRETADETLLELGIDPKDLYNEWTNKMISNPADLDIKKTQNQQTIFEKRIAELEAKLVQQDEYLQNQTKDAETQTLKMMEVETKAMVAANPEKFRIIKDLGLESKVPQFIQKYFETNDQVLSIDEAVDLIKQDYKDQYDKLHGVFGTQQVVNKNVKTNEAPLIKTLSNNMAAPTSSKKAWSEKRAEIIAKYGG
jgi:hypothetical protein